MPDAQWHRRDVPSSDAVHPRGVIDLDGPALIIMGSGMLLARGLGPQLEAERPAGCRNRRVGRMDFGCNKQDIAL